MRLTGPAALAVMAFVIGACDTRPPLVVERDAGADREMRSRIPTCQPGIRETSCTSAADAQAPDSEADGGGDGSVPEVGSATDARGVVDGEPACQPTGGATGDFRLVDIQPRQVTAHAAVTFTIKYEGEPPAPQALWLRMGNQLVHVNPTAVDATSSSLKMSFHGDLPAGPRRVDALVGNSPPSLAVVAWLDCAVQVATLPARPALVPPYPDGDTLGVPLHPELSRPCARSARFGVSNQGDDLVTVRSVALTGAPAFTLGEDHCTGQSLAYDADLEKPCAVKVCFTDTTPGSEAASLTFHTSAGDLKADMSSSVLPATQGLDRSFAGTGALLPPSMVQGATLLDNGVSLAIWDASYSLLFVSAEGDVGAPAVGDPPAVDSWVLDSISDMRSGAPGQGIYALVSPSGLTNPASVIRFFDDGTRDQAFAGAGTLVLDDFLIAPYAGIEVQPSGRALVIGTDYPSYGVRAFRPSGEEDVAYRTTIDPLVDLNRGAIRAIDESGRLYVATASAPGVVRLGPDGGGDPGFSFSGPVERLAVDRDQHLLVAASGKLSRLDEAGTALAIPLGAQPELAAPLAGIAVDARGRILLTSSGGAVLRYLADGTFDGKVGFAEGGARAVVCPRRAGCLIAGRLSAGGSVYEPYVLRLAP